VGFYNFSASQADVFFVKILVSLPPRPSADATNTDESADVGARGKPRASRNFFSTRSWAAVTLEAKKGHSIRLGSHFDVM
jgi:hypothetical protein